MIFRKVTFFMFLCFLSYTTKAQIIYTDIDPDTTAILSDPPNIISSFFSIDFNGDNTEEYNFRWDILNSGWWVHMTCKTGNELHLRGTDSNSYGARYIQRMTSGSVINSNSNWGDSTPEPLIGDISDPNFQGLDDCYVGCKFAIGNHTHYGWVRVSFDNNNTLTIKDYAYQSTPDTPIEAGEISVGVHDTEFDKYFKVYPNPAYDEIVFESNQTIQVNSLSLISLSGQALLTEKNSNSKKVIDISDLNSGFYMLQIVSDNGKWYTKIIVE